MNYPKINIVARVRLIFFMNIEKVLLSSVYKLNKIKINNIGNNLRGGTRFLNKASSILFPDLITKFLILVIMKLAKIFLVKYKKRRKIIMNNE